MVVFVDKDDRIYPLESFIMGWTIFFSILFVLYLRGLAWEFRYACGASEAIKKSEKKISREYYVSCPCGGPVRDDISHWSCCWCKREVEPTRRDRYDVKKSELMELVGSGYSE